MPHFQRTPEIAIWYLDEGPRTAPVILLIPGLTCDLHDWSWQITFLLSLGLRVISMDLRGQGRSSAPTPTPGITTWPGPSPPPGVIDYYPQTCAHDGISLLESLGVAKTIVMGHSLGDLVGYYLTVTRPDLVTALVGVDPIHRWGHAWREANANFFDDLETVVEKMLVFFAYSYPPHAPDWQKAWHARRAAQMDPLVMYALSWGGWGDRENGLGRKEVAVREYSGRLKCPRLTFGCNEEAVAADKNELPKGSDLDECVLIEGEGHWFHQTASERFNQVLKGWLDKLGVLPVRPAQ
ncbi:Alpha/Beta hydrolase protein [Lasiosphaeris hirsuta]|uniref:Alpha/Beta hydrolase protein n=1 Tax=Lasiosphaeris hirsuta TaxID=260670 RepID=A0AA40A7K6_9PEZI|nr:Alpha/Beta hydrolase protein [Lasiosphaeris hirsuta]